MARSRNTSKVDLGKFLKLADTLSGQTSKKTAEEAGISATSYSTLKRTASCNTTTLKRIFDAMNEPFIIKFKGVEYEIVDKQ